MTWIAAQLGLYASCRHFVCKVSKQFDYVVGSQRCSSGTSTLYVACALLGSFLGACMMLRHLSSNGDFFGACFGSRVGRLYACQGDVRHEPSVVATHGHCGGESHGRGLYIDSSLLVMFFECIACILIAQLLSIYNVLVKLVIFFILYMFLLMTTPKSWWVYVGWRHECSREMSPFLLRWCCVCALDSRCCSCRYFE